ncbi:MAG TPA: hypothetical protein VJ946_07985 [Bacteroidales bacterium]|nr:hypothetical protein [Bacteroidales bacterium]
MDKPLRLMVNRSFLLTLMALFVVNFLFEYYYTSFIIPTYKENGIILDFNWLKYLEGKFWLLILMAGACLLNRSTQFISSLFVFLLLLLFLPAHIIYAYSDGMPKAFYSVLTFFVIFGFLGSQRIKLKTVFMPEWIKYTLLLAIMFIMLVPVVMDFKLNISPQALKLQNIYDVREVFKLKSSGFTDYTFWWLAKAVLPVLLVFSMIRRDPKVIVLSLLILAYLFLISGHKSVYATPLLILFYYFFGKTYNDKIKISIIAILVLLLLINIPDFYLQRPMFKSLIVRRVFFVPAILNEFYFDFFDHNHLFLSHSVFSGLTEYPYDVMPTYLIGEHYFDKPEMSSNVGIVADGFMNFGYIGVVVYSTLFSFIMVLLNSIKLNLRYFGIFVFYMMIFRGTAFLTAFLTHGFWLLLIFAFIVIPKHDS